MARRRASAAPRRLRRRRARPARPAPAGRRARRARARQAPRQLDDELRHLGRTHRLLALRHHPVQLREHRVGEALRPGRRRRRSAGRAERTNTSCSKPSAATACSSSDARPAFSACRQQRRCVRQHDEQVAHAARAAPRRAPASCSGAGRRNAASRPLDGARGRRRRAPCRHCSGAGAPARVAAPARSRAAPAPPARRPAPARGRTPPPSARSSTAAPSAAGRARRPPRRAAPRRRGTAAWPARRACVASHRDMSAARVSMPGPLPDLEAASHRACHPASRRIP